MIDVHKTGNFTRYHPDGRIDTTFTLQLVVVNTLRQQGELYVAGWHDADTHYVHHGEVVRRPPNPARLDGMTLRDLPVPCAIVIDGTRYECADHEAELELPVAKTYRITVEAFPMVDATFDLEVPA